MLTTPPENEALRSVVMDLGYRLFCAVQQGDTKTTRLILEHIPAGIHVTHLADENLVNMAEAQKHPEIAGLIRAALAKS